MSDTSLKTKSTSTKPMSRCWKTKTTADPSISTKGPTSSNSSVAGLRTTSKIGEIEADLNERERLEGQRDDLRGVGQSSDADRAPRSPGSRGIQRAHADHSSFSTTRTSSGSGSSVPNARGAKADERVFRRLRPVSRGRAAARRRRGT
jgi:hypothetical protein